MFADSPQMTFRFRPFFARIRQSAFAKNMLLIMSGSVIAQALSFALSPVISRLVSPEDFGVFGSFNAMLNVMSSAATLEYAQTIVLPKETASALRLLVASIAATLATSLCLLFASLLMPGLFKSLIGSTQGWLLGLLIVAVLVSGLNQTLQAWCVRVKAFKETSRSQVIRSVGANGAQVGLSWGGTGAFGLVFGSTLGDALACVNLGSVVVRDLKGKTSRIRWAEVVKVARDYVDFPMYSASRNVINSLSRGLAVLLLTHYYGIAVAGAYAFGVRLLFAPCDLVIRAVRQVLFQKACEIQHRGGRLLPLYLKTTLGLFALALPPSLVVIVWAPALFGWAFGSKWIMAGEFARALVFWCIIAFASVPSNLFASVIRIQGRMFVYEVALLATRTMALFVGGTYLSGTGTVWLFSLTSAVMSLLGILIVGFPLMRTQSQIRLQRAPECIREQGTEEELGKQP